MIVCTYGSYQLRVSYLPCDLVYFHKLLLRNGNHSVSDTDKVITEKKTAYLSSEFRNLFHSLDSNETSSEEYLESLLFSCRNFKNEDKRSKISQFGDNILMIQKKISLLFLCIAR